ncbi:triacylglycerol lipase ptl2 [Schizosaccharomyces osmophilus]|uniref:Triacylglycerol lipase ptl2 n=1 Tax=Schizosaccharomyces osmophilus TaxID=2545709 RepID=A0AAE9W772_9SCHI|nr:triacylglycerol lipase ptl2 [Schizosaccharomyces osmophilus]WBW71099.1 triacylglycerol lipase ptl2 [Schizosaccharomyces osmophilus]
MCVSENREFSNDYTVQEDLDEFVKYTCGYSQQIDKKIEYIIAQHDWNPVHEAVLPKKTKAGKDEKREGFMYPILRWPLMITASICLSIVAFLYLLDRMYINCYEYFIVWRGRPALLRRRLQNAKTFEEWKQRARDLDDYFGNNEWKLDPVYDYYDYSLLRTVLRSLRIHRQRGEWEQLKSTLDVCVRSNFAAIDSPMLYSRTYSGTKKLVEDYIDELIQCLQLVIDQKLYTSKDRSRMFEFFSHNYGRTALCLSGGASFALYHTGVLAALLNQDLLPNVITGTSGGGILAALVCTRTNDELRQLLVPELAPKFQSDIGSYMDCAKRYLQTGARFDEIIWARTCMFFTRGSMTFAEAYKRTGRILNISVIPSDAHSPPKLINYLTSPDTVIWSAVIASCAVPGILNPIPLMTRGPSGKLIPHNFGNRFKDGSLRTDIPLGELRTQFNVHFSIVSQTNPHVQVFFFSPRGSVGRPVSHRKGRGWRGGYVGSAIEQYLKYDMIKWLHVIRSLELLPRPLGQDWSNVFLQKFDGTITIWPKTKLKDFWYILSPPSNERLGDMIAAGKAATFPKVDFISSRIQIEKLIEKGRAMDRLTTLGTSIDGDIGTSITNQDMDISLESATVNPNDVAVNQSNTSPKP